MSAINVNTDGVVNTANNIKTANNQLNNEFETLKNAISELDGVWNGEASNNAISKFNKFKSCFPQKRYSIVNDYVNFLYQQVGQDYEKTETIVTGLSELFK